MGHGRADRFAAEQHVAIALSGAVYANRCIRRSDLGGRQCQGQGSARNPDDRLADGSHRPGLEGPEEGLGFRHQLGRARPQAAELPLPDRCVRPPRPGRVLRTACPRGVRLERLDAGAQSLLHDALVPQRPADDGDAQLHFGDEAPGSPTDLPDLVGDQYRAYGCRMEGYGVAAADVLRTTRPVDLLRPLRQQEGQLQHRLRRHVGRRQELRHAGVHHVHPRHGRARVGDRRRQKLQEHLGGPQQRFQQVLPGVLLGLQAQPQSVHRHQLGGVRGGRAADAEAALWPDGVADRRPGLGGDVLPGAGHCRGLGQVPERRHDLGSREPAGARQQRQAEGTGGQAVPVHRQGFARPILRRAGERRHFQPVRGAGTG